MLAMRAIAALAVGTAMMFESWAFIMPHQAPTDTLILVNKTNRAPAVPVTLVKPNVTPTKESLSENIYMQPEAAAALEDLFEGALEDGITLYATSGYRSYATQKAIFDRKLETMSEKAANASVAKPGYSEHQTGLAMDVEGLSSLGSGLVQDFGETPEGMWIAAHCHEYGFILRYPKDKTDITCLTRSTIALLINMLLYSLTADAASPVIRYLENIANMISIGITPKVKPQICAPTSKRY